jgi:hypothetical protein
MAIKVNNTAESKEGLIIPSGYLIGFDMIIPDNTKELHYSPKVYISELARTEGKSQVYPSFISELAHVYKPTDEEFANLNPVAVNTFYQTYLESIAEIGTDTEIIL